MKIIHIAQRHKLPFGIKPNPEYIDQVVQSQLLVARAIKEHPQCPVLCEEIYEDASINPDSPTPMSLAVKSIFPDGIPEEFNKLTDLQKEFIYEKGAAETLFYLEEIQSLNKSIHENISKMVDEKLKNKMQSNIIFTLREKETITCAKEAALKHFGTLDGATVLIVYGGAHDFKPYCDEEGFDHELVATHITPQNRLITSLAKSYIRDIQHPIFTSPTISTSDGVKYQVDDLCLLIKKNKSGYRLSILKDEKEVTGSSLEFTKEKDLNELTDAMKNGTQSLINSLKTWGETGSRNANLLQEGLSKENRRNNKPY